VSQSLPDAILKSLSTDAWLDWDGLYRKIVVACTPSPTPATFAAALTGLQRAGLISERLENSRSHYRRRKAREIADAEVAESRRMTAAQGENLL